MNDLDGINRTTGFWVHMKVADTLFIIGEQPTYTSIILNKGWNLVGYPSLTPRLLADALPTIAGKYDAVEHYNASAPSNPWESSATGTLTMMRPGEGY